MNLVHEFEYQTCSKLAEAMANDDEALDEYVKEHGEPKPNESKSNPTIRISEYTPELSAISDMQEMLQSLLHAAYKKKGKAKISKQPRPTSAITRRKKRRRQQNISHLESMIVRDTALYESAEDDGIAGASYKGLEDQDPPETPQRGMRKPKQ